MQADVTLTHRNALSLQVDFVKSFGQGKSRHDPLAAATVLAQALRRLDLHGSRHADMMVVLQQYLSACGLCEKVSRTPIPKAYSQCDPPASASAPRSFRKTFKMSNPARVRRRGAGAARSLLLSASSGGR